MTKKIPIEDLLPNAGYSIYRLVRMASKRAMELAEGKPPLIKNPTTDKETTTALEEIHQGRLFFEDGIVKRTIEEDAAKLSSATPAQENSSNEEMENEG